MDKRMEAGLNQQINMEFGAAYLYLSMAAYFESKQLPGFAHWMRLQSQEELGHGMRIFDHILERGGVVELGALEAPLAEFESPRAVFEQSLEHEQRVTASIQRLYAQALEVGDYAAEVMLQWFVTEQVEEEASASAVVGQLELIGDHGPALLMLDRELAARAGDEE
jgi:ferritin